MKQAEHADNLIHERAGFMKHGKPINLRRGEKYALLLAVLVLLLVGWTWQGSAAPAAEGRQSSFASPEDAMQTLVTAAKARDRAALAEIFGPGYDKLLSGDPVQDNRELEQFVTAVDKSARLEAAGDGKVTLTIGADNWPFPIPIVKRDGKWSFDTAAGTEEILNRRIGGNELSAIATCRAYVLAQWEYFTEGDHDTDGVAEYAQHFSSAPGQKDGLYWDTVEGEKPSPMGSLVAAARTEGYPLGQGRSARGAAGKDAATARHRTPYHGYFFKILKRQGPHAPGGKYDYVINGNMIAGYALIAYPDKYGSSGIMTFIVNQQGRVYQKDLGPDTLKLARAIREYDPDASWKLVKD